jgi:hypothetical protein
VNRCPIRFDHEPRGHPRGSFILAFSSAELPRR